MPPINRSAGQDILRCILLDQIWGGTPTENYRPPWLNGLELDFFYEEFGLAFEFQGDQHFLPVFGQSTMESQQSRDAAKRRLCRERRVVLVKVEAWELRKLKLKAKIFAALNCYRHGDPRNERREWYRSLGIKKGRRKNWELIDRADDYCAHIQSKYGGVTTIPKKHCRKRDAAADRFILSRAGH